MPAVSYNPHYTIADYLTWDGDWELWNGTPVSMSPSPNFRHQQVAGNMYALLRQQLRQQLRQSGACRDCHLAYEVDWHVDEHTVVRPDILIVCGNTPREFVETVPAMIVEILSPSTATKDRTAKRDLYALNNVSHYLLIDPDSQSLIHFTPVDSDGRHVTDPVTLPLHGDCSVTIDPAAIWN